MIDERLIAELFQKDESGRWKQVGEQDMTDFGLIDTWNFYCVQLHLGRNVITKRVLKPCSYCGGVKHHASHCSQLVNINRLDNRNSLP